MWRVIGASVRGSSHVRNGTPCQDSFLFRRADSGTLIVGLADGLGSALHAEVGSALAVETVVEVLESRLPKEHDATNEFWNGLLQTGFESARLALELHAEMHEIELRELATTLLVAIFHPEWLAIGHLGDGAIIGVWDDDFLTTISAPERGEYANLVVPLTSADALEQVRYSVFPTCPISAVMMSDGLQHLALDAVDVEPYPAFFLPLVRGIRKAADPAATAHELERFLASERIDARTDDDRTLVIVDREVSAKPRTKRRRLKLRRNK